MPRSRRQHRRRTPTDFSAIPVGERTRWSLGIVVVEGEFTPVKHACGIRISPWPSWEAWALTYRACRESFLAYYAASHPGQEPGSEALYRAFLDGDDPANVVIPRPLDPRWVLQHVSV